MSTKIETVESGYTEIVATFIDESWTMTWKSEVRPIKLKRETINARCYPIECRRADAQQARKLFLLTKEHLRNTGHDVGPFDVLNQFSNWHLIDEDGSVIVSGGSPFDCLQAMRRSR